MTNINDLIEFHEIAQLKYRYCRALDTHQWDLMEQCFTEDAQTWYSGGHFTHQGRSNIVSFLKTLLNDSCVGSHTVTHPEIKLTSPTTAQGIWRLQDIVYFTAANPTFAHGAIQGGEAMTGACYVYEEYRKEAAGWKISRTGYERIFEVIERKPARANIELSINPGLGLRSPT